MNELIAYKCTDCGHYTISRRDGVRCSKCNGNLQPMGHATNADRNKSFDIQVSVKDFEIFKKMLVLLKDIFEREDIPESLKREILNVVFEKEDIL